MAVFTYKIVNAHNKLAGGTVSAFSKSAAEKALSKDGSTVLFLAREKGKLASLEVSMPRFGFSKPERIHFFRNFSTMIGAGLAVIQTLRVLEEQMKARPVKTAIREIRSDIENGLKLSSAMRKHHRHFSEYLVESVSIGEISGRLSDTLEQIATDLEYDFELTRKVRGAMAYPIVVVSVMVVVVSLITVLILPKIADLFTGMNADLPLPTQIMLSASIFTRTHPVIIGTALLLCFATFMLSFRFKRSRKILHFIMLKIPVFGELIREFNLARFFRSLQSLFGNGISLARSVEISKKTLKNDVYRDTLDTAYPMLLHGTPLSEALIPFPFLFPLQTRRLLETGEKTGKLDEIFTRITAHYERAIRHKTQMLASLIEPVLILLIGVVVGGLAISVFLPIYQIATMF